MKVAVFSTKSYDQEFLSGANSVGRHHFTFYDAVLSPETSNLTQGFQAICVFVNDQLGKQTIKRIADHGVGLIALRCAGFNNVDLHAAGEHRIKVARVPAYSPQAVAEYALSLILTLNRKTHKAYNRVREGNFSLERLMGFTLHKKTVGVIGTGKIGAIFCELMLAFGSKVLAYDQVESPALKAKGIIYCSLDDLLASSDIISLHCPLTPETHHLFNAATFAKMKTGAMLINTGRGAVIRTADAIAALKSGKLGYLGIDVYEQEENLFFRDLSEHIIQDELILRLMSFPNVLITAHQGFFTREALEEIARTTVENISAFEQGLSLENEVKLS